MLGVSVQQAQYHLGLHLRKNIIRLRFPSISKMVKLANLFFLLFSTVSPKPLSLNNNSSMDVEANPNISPMVLFKSNTLPTETTFFSTKPNPLQIKPKLPILIKPLPVFATGMGATMDTEWYGIVTGLGSIVLATFGLVTIFLLLGLLLAVCVNQCRLLIQCNANYSKRAACEEI